MTAMTPARPSLLAIAWILAIAGSLALTGAASPADAASLAGAAHGGTRAAAHGSGAKAAVIHLEPRRGGSGHPAEVTAAQQARALRYWTAARMVRARPPGPQKDAAIAPISAVPAVVPGARAQARRGSAAVLTNTVAAGWPGGGAVARATGKVFFTMGAQDYVCSSAVVASANADVVITAAHCVKNGTGSWAGNWTFVPGFTQGSRPYGSWTARHFFVASQWSHAANDNDDVAFVTLNPQKIGGRTLHIGQVAAGLPIRFGKQTAEQFAFGYPAEPPYNGGGLYYCSGRATSDAFHASPDSGLRCAMTAGSSGGPWLSGFEPATGTGTITSVSSFKYTTDPLVLYGPPLGVVARGLYNHAQHS